jgi:uncharacterized protein YndB with AHSA1/START domain
MRAWMAFGLLCITCAASGEVTDQSAVGFTSQHLLHVAATPTRTFQALTKEVDRWWDPEHSYSGEAANFSLDAVPGGCFCERWSTGAVEHMRVLYVERPRVLRLEGALGPLQSIGAIGHMEFILEAEEGGTRLRYRYAVGGYSSGGLDTLAEAVDQVQLGQLERLKRYVETGLPIAH